MKKIAVGVLLWPLSVAVGWFATALSERYAKALDDIEFDFE